MTKSSVRMWIAISLAVVATLLVVGSAYAYAAYHGTWNEQPDWGNHWWYNYSNSTLEWYADDYWSTTRADNMKYWHNNLPWNEYRIEQEAYNPGAGTSCDRLVIKSFASLQLPVTGWVTSNGCGSSSYNEELKLELDENAVSANTWLRHRVTYTERNRCSGGDGEVNYSFSHNHSASDSWMGKIVYDQCFNKKSSDPAGLVN